MKKNKGFTLVELLAVIVVLAVILVIAIPNIVKILDKSKKEAFESEIKMIIKAIRYKFIEEPNYDFTTLTVDKLESDFKIESKNIESIEVTKINEKDISFIIYGKGNAEGLVAYGINDDITLVTTAEYAATNQTLSNANIHEMIVPTGYVGIYKIEDLNNVRNNLAGNYILMNDLDFNADSSYQNISNKTTYTTGTGWAPIGSGSSLFTGIFNGNNHVIKNLYINNPTKSGLFSGLNSVNVKIEKLGLENVNITGSSELGAVASYISNGKISNVYVTGNIIGSSGYVGGLIGTMSAGNNTTIENSYSIANLRGTSYVGGIVGLGSGYYSYIKNCYAAGNITTTQASGTVYGGVLVGNAVNMNTTNSYRSSEATVTMAYGTANTIGTAKLAIDLKSELFITSILNWDTSIIWDVSLYDYPKLGGTNNVVNSASLEIKTIEDLYLMRKNLSGSYTLMNDLDFNDNASYRNINNKEYLTSLSGTGWLSIGIHTSAFTGTLNGNNHVIKNLYINNSSFSGGLFYYISSTAFKIEKLGLENVNINGSSSIGAIAGSISDGKISNVYVTGNIVGSGGYIGGLIGTMSASSNTTIENSYSIANVTGTSYVGGIVGSGSGYYSHINNCYAAGNITTTQASGTVYGGVLVGYINNFSTVNSYRSNEATVTMAYGTPNTTGTAKLAIDLKSQLFISGILNWDTSSIWDVSLYNYPKLGGTTSIVLSPVLEIRTIEDLYLMRKNLSGSYILMNDLDFNDNASYSNINNKEYLTSLSGTGWLPIGMHTSAFTGTLNGNNHVIKNLYINSPSINGGLFYYISSTTFKIEKLGLENVNITGSSDLGAVASSISDGKISNVYVTGNIVASGGYVGGLIGTMSASNSTIIENSYSRVNVTGTSYVGGIVGSGSGYSSRINNCYATGNITTTQASGTVYGGILIGYINSFSPSNSYRSNEATVTMAYGTPNTTGTSTAVSNLQNLSLTGLTTWDVSAIWKINTGAYPSFK